MAYRILLTLTTLSYSTFATAPNTSTTFYQPQTHFTESPHSENITQPEYEIANYTVFQNKNRFRQDGGDGDGDGGTDGVDTPDLGELQGIGNNVGQIVQGVLGGNFESIFKGATGFIEEEEAREGVSAILQGISMPLTQVFMSGYNYTKQYFGITTPNPLGAMGNLTRANNTLQATTTKTLDEDSETEIPEPPGPPPPPPKGTEEEPEDGSESEIDVEDAETKSLRFNSIHDFNNLLHTHINNNEMLF